MGLDGDKATAENGSNGHANGGADDEVMGESRDRNREVDGGDDR